MFIWNSAAQYNIYLHVVFVMSSHPNPIIDSQLKPCENYSTEMSGLNVSLLPVGKLAHLTILFRISSTVRDVQSEYCAHII